MKLLEREKGIEPPTLGLEMFVNLSFNNNIIINY